MKKDNQFRQSNSSLDEAEEEFMTFGDSEEIKERSWIRNAVGSGSHVIAEITGIHKLISKSKKIDDDDDDDYSPIKEDTNANKYIPTYGLDERAPSAKSMQFGNDIEKGYTEFNNVAQKMYQQANKQMIKPRGRQKRKDTTTLNTIIKLLVFATIILVAAAGYKKFQEWSHTNGITAKLLREKQQREQNHPKTPLTQPVPIKKR